MCERVSLETTNARPEGSCSCRQLQNLVQGQRSTSPSCPSPNRVSIITLFNLKSVWLRQELRHDLKSPGKSDEDEPRRQLLGLHVITWSRGGPDVGSGASSVVWLWSRDLDVILHMTSAHICPLSASRTKSSVVSYWEYSTGY